MNSKISICNMALAYLGQAPITSLAQDNEQARWLSLFYDPVRDEVLRTHDWGFASTEQSLLCLQTPSAGQGEYVYKYPAGALFIRGVYAPHAPKTPVAFTERFDTRHRCRVLLTTVPNARVYYTRRVTDETLFDAAFAKCLALALACDTALALTGDVNLAARLQQKYALQLEEARRANMTERCVRVPAQDAFSEVR